MGRTRGKFTNKVIYIENSGLQPIGGQYLQNVNGILYWNGISVATLPTLAGDVAYDDAGNTYVIGDDVDEALGSIETELDNLNTALGAISYPVTTAQNGLSLNGTIVELGTNTAVFTASISGTTMTVTGIPVGTIAVGQLVISGGNSAGHIAANTIITGLGTGSGGAGTYTVSISQTIASSTFTSVVPLTKSTTVSGSVSNPLKIAGEIQLKPVSATTTSQNKSLQLANTTGALSLVNRGMYIEASYSYSSLKQVTIAAADGLTPSATNSSQNILPGSVRDWNYYSRVANSGSNDGATYSSGISLNNLIGTKILVTLTLFVRSNTDIIAMVLGADGYGNLWTNEYGVGVGCPKRLAGLGYLEGVYCRADEVTRLESSYIFDTTSGNGALGNWGDMGIYRNTGIAGTDASSAIITILGAKERFQQQL